MYGLYASLNIIVLKIIDNFFYGYNIIADSTVNIFRKIFEYVKGEFKPIVDDVEINKPVIKDKNFKHIPKDTDELSNFGQKQEKFERELRDVLSDPVVRKSAEKDPKKVGLKELNILILLILLLMLLLM